MTVSHKMIKVMSENRTYVANVGIHLILKLILLVYNKKIDNRTYVPNV